MKRTVFVLTLVFAASISALGQTTKPGKAESEVRAAITAWADAVKTRDTVKLAALFADDLFITDYNGGTRGKKEELEVLKPSPGMHTISVENSEVAVRTYGRAAVVTAIVKMVFDIGGKRSTMQMRYTSVWERRRGGWQLTVLQTARIATPKGI